MHCRVTPSTLSQAVGPGLHLESSSHTEYAAAGQALSTQKYASPGPGRRATNHMASFQFFSLSLSFSPSLSLSPSLPLLDLARGQENPARGGLSNPERGAGWGLGRGQKRTPKGVYGTQENPARGGTSSLDLSLSLSFARAILSLSLSVPTAESVGLAAVCVCVCVCHKLRLQSHSCSRRTLEVLLQNQKYHS